MAGNPANDNGPGFAPDQVLPFANGLQALARDSDEWHI
jgi:hypothetical protein